MSISFFVFYLWLMAICFLCCAKELMTNHRKIAWLAAPLVFAGQVVSAYAVYRFIWA